jgi:hypothetical protein
MKWNFECEIDRRDYLHPPVKTRCNGFPATRLWANGIRRQTNIVERDPEELQGQNFMTIASRRPTLPGGPIYLVGHFIEWDAIAPQLRESK